jgi:hypothetical protein
MGTSNFNDPADLRLKRLAQCAGEVFAHSNAYEDNPVPASLFVLRFRRFVFLARQKCAALYSRQNWLFRT